MEKIVHTDPRWLKKMLTNYIVKIMDKQYNSEITFNDQQEEEHETFTISTTSRQI